MSVDVQRFSIGVLTFAGVGIVLVPAGGTDAGYFNTPL